MNKKITASWVSIFLFIGVPFLTSGTVAWAQAGRGGISGLVSDPSGAVVPGAKVTALNKATGIAQSTVTTAAGLYSFVSLNPHARPKDRQRTTDAGLDFHLTKPVRARFPAPSARRPRQPLKSQKIQAP